MVARERGMEGVEQGMCGVTLAATYVYRSFWHYVSPTLAPRNSWASTRPCGVNLKCAMTIYCVIMLSSYAVVQTRQVYYANQRSAIIEERRKHGYKIIELVINISFLQLAASLFIWILNPILVQGNVHYSHMETIQQHSASDVSCIHFSFKCHHF